MKKIINKYIKSILVIILLLLLCDFLSALAPYIVKQVIDIDFNREDITRVLVSFIGIYMSEELYLSI